MTAGVVAAVDVGGTSVKGLLVDAHGRAGASVDRPTPRGPDEVVATVRAVVEELVRRAGAVAAVGVAVPGEVEPEVARYSANLGWRDGPATAFAAGLGVPVVLDHDVRCAALADRAVGATRGVRDACVIVIGTGVASVSTAGGVPVTGASGLAGELGHAPVRPAGEVCACGQLGCLEAYASAAAIARRYRARTGRGRAAHEVVAALGTDSAADEVWRDAVGALATACVIVTMVQDPEVIAFAGGLTGAGAALLDPLRVAVSSALTWRPAPRLELSPLGARAGRVGIALRAWQAAGVTVDGWDHR